MTDHKISDPISERLSSLELSRRSINQRLQALERNCHEPQEIEPRVIAALIKLGVIARTGDKGEWRINGTQAHVFWQELCDAQEGAGADPRADNGEMPHPAKPTGGFTVSFPSLGIFGLNGFDASEIFEFEASPISVAYRAEGGATIRDLIAGGIRARIELSIGEELEKVGKLYGLAREKAETDAAYRDKIRAKAFPWRHHHDTAPRPHHWKADNLKPAPAHIARFLGDDTLEALGFKPAADVAETPDISGYVTLENSGFRPATPDEIFQAGVNVGKLRTRVESVLGDWTDQELFDAHHQAFLDAGPFPTSKGRSILRMFIERVVGGNKKFPFKADA